MISNTPPSGLFPQPALTPTTAPLVPPGTTVVGNPSSESGLGAGCAGAREPKTLPHLGRQTVAGAVGTEARPNAAVELRQRIAAPLFDPNDPLVREAAPGSRTSGPPIDRDRWGAEDILREVDAFGRAHPGHEVVVVYSGAGVHSWLALPQLRQLGFADIPATLQPFDTNLVNADLLLREAPREQKVAQTRDQMSEDMRVTTPLGFKTYEDFHASRVSQPLRAGQNLFIGVDETGFHGATYARESSTGRGNMIYRSIADYVAARQSAGAKVAVLYLTEAPSSIKDSMQTSFDRGDFRPNVIDRDILFSQLKRDGVAVGFAGVSYREQGPNTGPGLR
jgi:hypothetical protein